MTNAADFIDFEEQEIPGPNEYLRATFGKGGYLAQKFDSYKIRLGQCDLAKMVDASLKGEEGKIHAVGEGPTGTGKSLAYCVPATYHSHRQGKPIIIATANIALQEQLVEKDLPLLREILPWKFSFALLKGINNYLCLDSAERFIDQASVKQSKFSFDDRETGQAEQLIEWTRLTRTGDKSELDFIPGALWSNFSTTSDDCKRDKCEHYNDCFAMHAVMKAKNVDVIVTNFHMLFAHIAVARKTHYTVQLLPPALAVICDEAHKMPDIAREFFGTKVSFGGIKRLLRRAKAKKDGNGANAGLSEQLIDRAEQETLNLFAGLTEFKMNPKLYSNDRLRAPIKLDAEDFFSEIKNVRAMCRDVAKNLELSPFGMDKKGLGRIADLQKIDERLYEATNGITACMNQEFEPEEVYYLEDDTQGRAVFRSKIVNIAPILAHDLFSCGELRLEDGVEGETDPRPEHVIVTSATITTDGNFNFIARELGVPMGKTRTVIGRSPFSEEQALLIVPDNIPFANGATKKDFEAALPHAMIDCVRMAKGRTLCLFTSYYNLRSVKEAMLNAQLPYTILVQGDAPRTQLIKRFKEDVSSVLLGTESFWAGVDVPGEALSCLVIDRLPFPTPADPVMSMLCDNDSRAFFTEMIPRASIQLKQGFGRAIRAVTDRAAIVILDRRIVDKGYGTAFTKSLPRTLRTRRLKAVQEFLER